MEKYVFNCDYEILVGISLIQNLSFEEKVKLAGRGVRYSELEMMLGNDLSFKWDEELKWADDDKDGVYKGHLFVCDEDYPKSLLEQSNPPFVLSYRGAKPIGCSGNFRNAESITIVGTREASEDGRRAAFLLSLEAASNGIVVYSGYATGIDQASHKGAVVAEKTTIAVLPCGLGHSYAYRNKELIHSIYDAGGGFISQFSHNEEPYKWNFHYRNRLLAQISDATVIVQAPESSGALITVRDALDSGKDVFVHKAGNGDFGYQKGTQRLINDGAMVINSYSDIVSYTLNAFKGSKRAEEISYFQIEHNLKLPQINEAYYRFSDTWYHIV